jgi:hypothetical protein
LRKLEEPRPLQEFIEKKEQFSNKNYKKVKPKLKLSN